MPKRALTDRYCQTAKSIAVQTDYFDAQCSGLALRVASTGRKTWSWFFTWGGKRARMTLGTYPATSLAAARTKAEEARSAIEGGRDPRATVAKAGTLQSIFEDYLRRQGPSVRSIGQREAVFNRLILPTLGASPINEIRRSDIIRLLDTIEDERGPSSANGALGHLSAVMNWHAARDDDFIVPIRRGMAREENAARDRVLSDDEVRTIWATDYGMFSRYVRFLLLTGLRRTEAADMTWEEIAGDVLTIPANRMKGKQIHVVPLPLRARECCGVPSSGLVFRMPTGKRIMPNIAYLKRGFDEACGVKGWVLHDVRRTARSLLSRAGVAPDIAERVLAHNLPTIRGIYDRHAYLDEKRDALARLARLIGGIVNA